MLSPHEYLKVIPKELESNRGRSVVSPFNPGVKMPFGVTALGDNRRLYFRICQTLGMVLIHGSQSMSPLSVSLIGAA